MEHEFYKYSNGQAIWHGLCIIYYACAYAKKLKENVLKKMKKFIVAFVVAIALLFAGCSMGLMDDIDEPDGINEIGSESRVLPLAAAVAVLAVGSYAYNCPMPPDADGFLANLSGLYYAPGITKIIPAAALAGSATCSDLQEWVDDYFDNDSKLDAICKTLEGKDVYFRYYMRPEWHRGHCTSYNSWINSFMISHDGSTGSWLRSHVKPLVGGLLWKG